MSFRMITAKLCDNGDFLGPCFKSCLCKKKKKAKEKKERGKKVVFVLVFVWNPK